ncbi:MAG: hypothetical protein Q9227_006027 [Pyrenula ochraceoflavens]
MPRIDEQDEMLMVKKAPKGDGFTAKRKLDIVSRDGDASPSKRQHTTIGSSTSRPPSAGNTTIVTDSSNSDRVSLSSSRTGLGTQSKSKSEGSVTEDNESGSRSSKVGKSDGEDSGESKDGELDKVSTQHKAEIEDDNPDKSEKHGDLTVINNCEDHTPLHNSNPQSEIAPPQLQNLSEAHCRIEQIFKDQENYWKAQKASLEEKLSKQQKTTVKLLRSGLALNSKFHNMKEQRDRFEEELEDTRTALNERKELLDKNADLRKTIKVYKIEAKDLKVKLKVSEEKANKLVHQNNSLSSDKANIDRENELLYVNLKTLTTDNETLRKENKDLREERKRLDRVLRLLKGAIKDLEGQDWDEASSSTSSG